MKKIKLLALGVAVMFTLQPQAQQIDTIKHTRNTIEYRITPPDKKITVTKRTVEYHGADSVVTFTCYDSVIHPSDTVFSKSKCIYSYVFSFGLGSYNSVSMIDALESTVLKGGENLGLVLNTECDYLYPVSDKWDLGYSMGLQGVLSIGELDESTTLDFPDHNGHKLNAINHHSDWRLGFLVDFVTRFNITQKTSLMMGIGPKVGFMPYHGYMLYAIDDNSNYLIDYENVAMFMDANGFVELGYTFLQGVNAFLRVGYSHALLSTKDDIAGYLDVYGKSSNHELVFLLGYRGDILSVAKTKRYKTSNSLIPEKVERVF